MVSILQELEAREYFGMRLGLSKIQGVLAFLQHPERKYPSIHVAGTNGKGSTAMTIAILLQQAGLRVGLFTSPHLIRLNERFWCDGRTIDDASLERLAREVDEAQKSVSLPEPLTFFEWVTAMVFLWFAEQKVDVAVLEVGLGGRLDSTNVVIPDVCVITSIGYDHAERLGKTLGEIAYEKAGIIKPGVPVICGVQDKGLQSVFQKKADQEKAEMIFVDFSKRLHRHDDGIFDYDEYKDLTLSLWGSHQCENASLAIEAARTFLKIHQISLGEKIIREGLKSVCWPGRLEWLPQHRTLLDGAHNVDAIRALVRFVEENYAGSPLTLLFGAMKDKEAASMLKHLAPFASKIIVTRPGLCSDTRHIVKRSLDPDLLKECLSHRDIKIIPDSQKAWQEARHLLGEGEIILVTGSLFLVGEVRQFLVHP
ncbi:MAG: hypothetical protein A3I75_00870 [Deltaproteobacteria bacterium RIFCSPLOWO2_02_FULL_50_16]|nr:MAG: hypothetical protein A3B79_02460 [Deltaproteobacteria bacterium RIFCSPHIGHO2_02_FULL_50_15]OGQ56377.1 MAG: hypothetical protein A3I75_00870 [Deltaproteobacteria bacterium RIFCSPLOWO2_02_FULL_50_16]